MFVASANNAAREKDPDFDIRKNLFDNLGDDMISYQKAPTGNTPADLNSPPGLFLLSSPHPDQLVASLKMIFGLLNSQGGPPKEREFLGRKIYSVPQPSLPLPTADTSRDSRRLNLVASGGYVAIGVDNAVLIVGMDLRMRRYTSAATSPIQTPAAALPPYLMMAPSMKNTAKMPNPAPTAALNGSQPLNR